MCGQDFTRRSAKRHNGSLHNGSANLIRPLDYITGRLYGHIYPPTHDRWAHRRNKHKDQSDNRLGSYMASSNGSFIKESMHWNHCIDYAIHEGNLPEQEQKPEYRQMNNYIRSVSRAHIPSDRVSKL
jgi:CDP-glycerol glycerophosphotransferase (TagB/SpsB family)